MDSTSWLMEEVWCGGGATMRRRRMIWQFTTRGLIPFLKSSGYTIGVTNTTLSTGIASILFHNRTSTLVGKVTMPERNDYSIEHKHHYNHVLCPKRWGDFWKEWSFWEDVDEIGLGFYRRLDIQEYCWAVMDLDASPQTRVIHEFMEGDDDGPVFYRDDYDDV